ncbi:hypothetical protein IGI04_035622, partial [Brassica rapa subsp. trilocularis]
KRGKFPNHQNLIPLLLLRITFASPLSRRARSHPTPPPPSVGIYIHILLLRFISLISQKLCFEEDLNMENVYYSEMKDAGFFDPDWE